MNTGATEKGINLLCLKMSFCCRTMCGLPFKMLDKKSEKQAMFARRMALKQCIEVAEGPKETFALAISILFQQVCACYCVVVNFVTLNVSLIFIIPLKIISLQLKNVATTGNFVTAVVLQLLLKEKKISESVGKNLQTFSDALQSGEELDEDLVNLIRDYGLCKDISKFEK